MKVIYAVIVTILFSFHIEAQELNVNARVIAPNNTTVDKVIFNNLEVAIREFFNNTKWTNDEFETLEKINANIQFTITSEINTNTFEADLIVQSNRPVYSSEYNTPMLNLIDKGVTITYNNFQPIERSENQYVDNLSSILTYYAYIILAFDYESFAPYGGEQYFKLAQQTMNVLPNNVANGDKGWNQNSSDRNRYWLIENIFNPRLRNFRAAFYDYHRLGLDLMYSDADRSRATILATMNTINEANSSYLNSMLLNLFVDTKGNELIEIFKVADRNQKSRVRTTLTRINPSNAGKYEVLR
ncbi:MAG: DUF4835 family protein [Saprospiraceae bacterium]|nr:DUF4835 family protein [Saprospiraceae bacterium]